MNLASILIDAAERRGDSAALVLDGAEWSYRALGSASARVASLARQSGVMPGDRVGVMLPNVPAFAACYYGVLEAGGIVVPMNVLLKRREVEYYLRDADAALLLVWPEFAEEALAGARAAGVTGVSATPAALHGRRSDEPLCQRADSDTAVILYTSGTTGAPKGAELTHASLLGNARAVARMHSLDADTVTLAALPLFHAFGQTSVLNATVVAGGCVSLMPRFDAGRALQIIERDAVAVVRGVPTMYGAMVGHPGRERFSLRSVRACISGGAPMPVELLHATEAAFGCSVYEGYGLSETSPVASSNHPDRPRKPGSIGTPIEGVEMELVDVSDGVGEIVIRGPNVMKGYWRRPEATAEAIDAGGWFHTGDLARVDDDGYFFIVDRKKELIIRGGYNVYPREIEEVLYEHPAVREAAVFGVPHDELGEEVAAAVALAAGSAAEPAELREFVRARVAAYKYPREITVMDELPKGATGKILKREISSVPRRGAEH